LLKPSSIKPAVSTVEQRLVLRILGKLSAKGLDFNGRGIKRISGIE